METIWDNNMIAKPLAVAITNGEKILYKRVEVTQVNTPEILYFILENCKNNKIYYVHNLTFEIFCLLKYLIKEEIKFKIISSNRIVYYAEIHHKKKKIKIYCSYRLTMLSLKKLAELCSIEQKQHSLTTF